MQNSYILTKENLMAYIDGIPYTVPVKANQFKEIIAEIGKNNWDKVKELIDTANGIMDWSLGKIKIKNNRLEFGEIVLHGEIVNTAIMMKEHNIDPSYLEKFLNKLVKNPSKTAVNELYDFLASHKLTINDDGDFYAYKWVTSDYLDCHTRTISNKIGDAPSMSRNLVDDNRNNYCSTGYHFCSSSYQKFGDKLMLVSINPADVVSIPADYNFSKGRCSAYKVVAELDPTTYGKVADAEVLNSPLIKEEDINSGNEQGFFKGV